MLSPKAAHYLHIITEGIMKRIATTINRTSLLRHASLLLFFMTLFSHQSKAADYYWVGGSGNWNDLSKWASTSNGTGNAYGNVPTSSDNVFFNGSSGFSAGNSTITFTNSSVVRNITVSGCTPSPTFSFGNASQNFDIYGDAEFQAGMVLTNFLCTIRFFNTPTNLNKIVQTNGNTFFGRWRYDAGTNGVAAASVSITGNFTLRHSFEINATNDYDRVNINGNATFIAAAAFNPLGSFPASNLNVVKGEIYFNAPFTATGNSYQFYVAPTGKLFSQANGSVTGLYNSGIVNLNYNGTNPTYTIGYLDINTAFSSPPSSVFNFANTEINVLNDWRYGRGVSSPFSIVSTGSHIRFQSTATVFWTQNYAYNDVTIEPSSGDYFRMSGSFTISNVTPTFDDFVIRRNTFYAQQGIPVSFTFTSNTFKVHPGLSVSNQHAVGRIAVNGTCDIVGTCQQPIRFFNVNFQFFGGSTVLSDYIYTEGISATGPATPYFAGGSSQVITGGSTGWNFSAASGRTLIWVAPLPSNTSDPNTYGNWTDPNNWRDAAIDPGASVVGPGFVGGTPACPPTFRDSVVFLNNSYVDVDVVHYAYSSGVNFVGTGTIYGPANLEWEIYAGLTFSANTTNNFMGTVWFRNNKTYECKIITKNVAFRSGVIMNAINAAGNWRLTDGDLIALVSDLDVMINWPSAGKTASFRLTSGHLHTGATNCTVAGSHKMRLYGLIASGGTMSWYGSDIEILGQGQVFDLLNPMVLNCGISNLKFDFRSTIPGSNQSQSLGNETYYKVSLLSSAGVSTQFSHEMTIAAGFPAATLPTIFELFVDANTLPAVALNGSVATPVRVKKATINAATAYFGLNWNPAHIGLGTIDSLIMTGNIFFHQQLRIRSYVEMAAGKNYVFGTAAQSMELMAPSSDASYSTCVSVPTNYTAGAVTNFNGSCSQFIRIENGFFLKNSAQPINAQYLNIVNNTITNGTGMNANGLLTGTTTNWSITVSPPRKLRWVDPSGLPYNATTNPSNWNDASRWEQLLPTYAPAPQCPPTKVDTIIFDNLSFPVANQGMAINTPLEVASMYCENNVNATSRIYGSATVSIFGSIKLPAVTTAADFMTSSNHNFEFRGIPTAQFPTFTIRSNGQRFRANLLFNSASDLARWDLQDSLALRSVLTLNRGRFYTNGFPMNAVSGGFSVNALNATDLRTMDITNSKIYTAPSPSGGFWRVNHLGPATNTTINALGSTIRVATEGGGNIVFNGGGYIYNDVIVNTAGNSSSPPTVMNITNGDEFNFIDVRGPGHARIQGGPNLKAKHIKTVADRFVLTSTFSIIDTMELQGQTSELISSNRFRDMFEVASGTTLFIGSNQVQWFDNDCPVNLIGASTTNNIQLYSNNPGVQGYLRKDSATVCADFIFMRDIWSIGNGNNPAACSSYGNTVPANGTNCPPIPVNPWIISSCDTISDDASNCGSWIPTAPLRGRAAFTAGANADNQGNVEGWDRRPYPPVPSIQLAAGSPAICNGQSVTLTITGIGKIPFYMDYTDNAGNTYPINITSPAQLAAYNATTNAFTYSTTVSPTTSTIYSAGVIIIERCFNSISPTGTGSVNVTVNPIPSITNGGLTQAICSATTGSFVPATTVPSSIAWTSPAVGGITGHSLSGTTTISEVLTNSTTSPIDVIYTLTPTAAGCVGSPVLHTITVNPRPNAVAGPAQSMSCIAPTATVTVSSSTPGVNYSWTGPSVTAGSTTNAATVDAIGTYTVIVTNPVTGCTSSGTVAVNFIPDTQAPTITCPANQTATVGAGSCIASVTNPNPITADNCGVTRLSWVMTGATAGNSPVTGINNVGTQSFNIGTTTVTYTIADAVGNTTTCAYTVTVTDPIAPTVVCPGNMTANTSAVSCTASVTTPNPTTNDNCSVTRLTWALTGATTANSPATGINNLGTFTFNLGVTTVNYTVADAAGNTSTCSYTVTVTDNVSPTISCSGNLSANTSAVSCNASVSTANPSIADNCSLASLTWSLAGATTANSSATGINNLGTFTFNRGITTVTYTVTDASGNSSTCSFTVTVTDNVSPIINCPANSSVNASALACNASVTTTNPTVSDNCGIATLTWSMSGATAGASPTTGINNVGTQTFNIGTTTITYVATDASGNATNCSFTVTVSDNLAPVFGTCPSNIAANTTSSTCDAPITTTAPVVTDNCSLTTLTWALTGATTANSPASGINNLGTQTFNLGVTTVTYTATDAAGNSSTCVYTVTITDNQAPVTPVLANVLGQCSAVVPVPTTTDNCAGIIFGTTPDPLTYNAQGTFTVTWTFNDGNGNSTTATQTVIVDNNLPPVPPLLPDVVAECNATVPTPVSTTNCSGPVSGTTTDPTSYSTQGTYVVTWSFDDGTGNIVTAPQNVIIDDVTPPVTPVLSAVSNECTVTLTAPTTTDNCVGTVTATTTDPLIYNSQGSFTVNWTFDDNNGNTATATQTVTINDVTPPTLTGCSGNISVNNDPGQCTATVNWVAPIASDNCAGVTLTSTHTSGSTFPTGTTTVTYTATDAGGNTISCSFDVTVTENEAPVIVGCPSTIVVGNDLGDCGANVDWTAPTATDNCPGVTLTSTHNPGDAFPTGTTTVTYTATDAAGNTASCSFDVTVNDTENPVIADCPSDIAIGNTIGNCDGTATWTAPTATDNCPGVTLSSTHNPGDVFPLGTTTVTYTATDAVGNTSTICSFEVTVTDQEDPVIAGLGDLSICEGGNVTWTPFITDNCPGVVFTSTHNSGDVFPLGTTTVTYTATDAAGNTSTASFNVDIYPLTPLVIEMNPTEVCAGDPLSLNIVNTPSNGTYEWTLNGVVVSTDPNYSLSSSSLLDNGVYDLVVTQPGGCVSYGQFTISLNPCDIIIPEALTPNGDGSNDLFAIENLENYPNSSVQIVNRWGNVVFEADDYKNDWDGTSYSNLNVGGDQLPEGTYYYVLTIGGDPESKLFSKVYTGFVYLKR